MPTREHQLEAGLLDAIADLEFIGTYSREPGIRQLADSAVDVAKCYVLEGMTEMKTNFSQVLSDIEEMQEERLEEFRAAKRAVQQAEQRLDYATLSSDMRLWSCCEADEYKAARASLDEAHDRLAKAKAAL